MDKLQTKGMVEMSKEELSTVNGGIGGLVVLAARGVIALSKVPAVRKAAAAAAVGAGAWIGWDLTRK
ncbi:MULTISPECIES: hypothetical protein [Paenibacillus]|uniref:hypothetical protein n=1 Tax=Paenibacillus TaxID=44249 RepID=UPI00203C19E2|nr:hypothetical protein [Paenibacillus camelliae]MCM3633341.1 hypothetical protein [Paenibacillus camelliae]